MNHGPLVYSIQPSRGDDGLALDGKGVWLLGRASVRTCIHNLHLQVCKGSHANFRDGQQHKL